MVSTGNSREFLKLKRQPEGDPEVGLNGLVLRTAQSSNSIHPFSLQDRCRSPDAKIACNYFQSCTLTRTPTASAFNLQKIMQHSNRVHSYTSKSSTAYWSPDFQLESLHLFQPMTHQVMSHSLPGFISLRNFLRSVCELHKQLVTKGSCPTCWATEQRLLGLFQVNCIRSLGSSKLFG